MVSGKPKRFTSSLQTSVKTGKGNDPGAFGRYTSGYSKINIKAGGAIKAPQPANIID